MKRASLALAATLIVLASACTRTPRQQCYDENYCSSADADCMAGWMILSSMMLTPSSSSSSSTSTSTLTTSPVFWMLMCSGSRQACEAECDRKYTF